MYEYSAEYAEFAEKVIKKVIGCIDVKIHEDEVTNGVTLLSSDRITGVSVALATIDPKYQEILKLRFMNNLSFEEIGDKLGISRLTAKKYLNEAIKKLRNTLVIGFILNGFVGEMRRLKATDSVKYVEAFNRGYAKALEDVKTEVPEQSEEIDNNIKEPIENLDLSLRSCNCLKRAGYDTVESLINISSERILGIRNIGRKSASEIGKKLEELGYTGTAWSEYIIHD